MTIRVTLGVLALLVGAGCSDSPRPGHVQPRRLFDERTSITGAGRSSCSHQEPASGDGHRWCAFAVPSKTGGKTELWVLDVTAAAGMPACDGTSTACRRLTEELWTAYATVGPGHPDAHAFDGDTLIFYAGSQATATDLHRGPVWAWRPGWPSAQQLTSSAGFFCRGHVRAAVAYCLDDVAGDPTKPNSVELRAGPIAAGAPILPSQGRIRPLTADERIAWQVEFSPAGDFLLMSSPDPDPMVESLRVLAMSALGVAAPVKLIDDAGTWSLAHDQKTLYFLRRQDGARRGLHAVPFPAGGAPTKLADDVLDYDLLGLGPADRGVAVLTRSATPPARLFQILRPGAEPAAQTVFATDDALEDVQLSDDGRFTAWRNGHLVTRIVGHDDLSSCLLNTSANVRATPALFLASAGLVFWTEDAPEDPTRQDAYVAAPDGCRNKRRYARGLYLELPVGDRGLVFGDNYEDRNFTVSLKYAGARQGRDGWELGAPVPVTDGVDSAVVLVATDPPSLVFRKKVGAPDETGLYLLGPIAF